MKDTARLSGKPRKPSWRKKYRRISPRFLLRQIVNLQADRIGAGSLDCVDHLYYIAVVQGARRLYEHGLLNTQIFRDIRSRFHADLIGVLFLPLLKRLLQLGSQVGSIVNRAHRILVELDLQIRGDRNDQRQRIRLEILYLFVGISLCWNIRLEAAGLERRDHHEDDYHDQQHVDQRRNIDVGNSTVATPGSHCHKLTLCSDQRVPGPCDRRSEIRSRLGCRGRRSRAGLLLPISNQSYLIDTFFADGVNDFDDFAIADLDAALDVNDLVFFLLVCEGLLDGRLQVIEADLLFPEIVISILRDRDNYGRFFVDSLVFIRVFQVARDCDGNALLQERRDHHEDDQQHQHHVHHRCDIDLRLQTTAAASRHSHKSISFDHSV